jgi:ATP-dependent Clp protease ATP-binding subunit ClpC
MDAANILKPALARGTIQCVGATTLNEYRNSIEKDGALERRFQKVLVEPTTVEETMQILHNIKDRYEDHHHVTYTDEALTACVKLTERYVTDRFFPDKAIDAMDEVGSRCHLQHATIPPEIIAKEKELEEVKLKKKDAASRQNYELAAGYRDRQLRLEQEITQLNEDWTKGSNDQREIITDEHVADVDGIHGGLAALGHGVGVDRRGFHLVGALDILRHEVLGHLHGLLRLHRLGHHRMTHQGQQHKE